MTTQQSSWGILCGFPKMRELDSLSRPQCSASLFIIINNINSMCMYCMKFHHCQFYYLHTENQSVFLGALYWYQQKKTTNLFVEPLLTAEITAQHEMLRCLLTEVTLQTEQQQLYSETFSNSKLNNSEIRVWDKQGLTQNCSSPTYSVFLAFLIQNIIC